MLALQSPVVPEGVNHDPLRIGYHSDFGTMYHGSIESLLSSSRSDQYKGRVQLVFTSPPFPLNRKKRYGNKVGDDYVSWLASLAPRLKELLSPDGSIVIEIGNAWEPGRPVMSTLALRALLAFMEKGKLELCQQFVCHNPARLPTPVQWVTVERIRVKDSYTHVWWFSPVSKPKANNKKVLSPYSPSMLELLRIQDYNDGVRPSGHKIGKESFKTNHGGAIPSNVLTYSNTLSNDAYRDYCKRNGLPIHPARMPTRLAEFFIKMLTDEGDLVMDPFAGSNTTGFVAEKLGRAWLAVEPNLDYIDGSRARFGRTRPGASLLYR
jgi:DNA modification methylase